MLRRIVSEGIGPIFAVGEEFDPIRRVLIRYEGSTNSRRAMKKFIQLKIGPDGSLRIVHFDDEDEKSKKLLLDAVAECLPGALIRIFYL